MTGMRPIVDITFMDFVVYMMDNIVNQAAKNALYVWKRAGTCCVSLQYGWLGVGSAAQHS